MYNEISGEAFVLAAFARQLETKLSRALARNAELEAENEELRKDAKRLYFLDSNLGMRMEWKFSIAHAGNIVCHSVIHLGDEPLITIREAIDSAMSATTGEGDRE
jgi:hypothetical protein